MDRARIWPDFRDAWIVYEDSELLVVDKPVGIPSQAADPARPDDILTRLKSFLVNRASGDPGGASEPHRDMAYLGVHQRLDRDTSGVLLMSRRRAANAHLAAQFEGRKVAKTYLACVTGWPPRRDKASLRDLLLPGAGGRMQCLSTRDRGAREAARQRGAQDAACEVRVLERAGDRTLLELSLETGRTHQARVQLAHAGAPVAGDSLYGGARAPRLMLHAAALSLEHPTIRRPMHFVAAAPPEFADWLAHGDAGTRIFLDDAALERALSRALERRWGLGRGWGQGDSDPRSTRDQSVTSGPTNAFRLVNEDGDALPRLAVDVYDSWLVAQLYEGEGPLFDGACRERLLDRLHALSFDGVYLKMRPKQSNTIDEARREELAPRVPVRGTEAPPEIRITENGQAFLVRLGDGLSTGLFLDQRNNRMRVRDLGREARVANLFAYTCGFSVAAALGGASRTVSIDASASALERGRANFALAGLLDVGDAKNAFVAQDAFAWLAKAHRRGERFDLVIIDPPSYSSTRRGRFVADSDYGTLAAAAIRVVGPSGRLLACTNHRGMSKARFRRVLFEACRAAGRQVEQVKDLAPPPDFPDPVGCEPNLKSLLVRLED